MSTVLAVSVERHVLSVIRRCLVGEGYRVEVADSAPEALEGLKDGHPDLVILDLALPTHDGANVCQEVSRRTGIPIIVLGAGCNDDIVAALDGGADDYLMKPFSSPELVARVRAVLRRYGPSPRQSTVLTIGDLLLDLAERRASVGGRFLALRPKEFDLLSALAERPGVVLDRRELARHVWRDAAPADLRVVGVYVAILRDRLGGSGVGIQTVWGVGYKLVLARSCQADGSRLSSASA